jgi:hypothetical protein
VDRDGGRRLGRRGGAGASLLPRPGRASLPYRGGLSGSQATGCRRA